MEDQSMHEYPQQQQFEGPKPNGGFTNRTKGSLPSEDRQYNVQHLREVHHAMKRMCLMGYNNKEIAQQLDVSQQTVANVLNSPMMKRELELARASLDAKAFDIAAEVQRLAPKAVAVLEQILDDDDAPVVVRSRVAMDNLSRNGVSPIVRGSLDVNHHFTAADLEQIKQNAYAAGVRAGSVVSEQSGSEASRNDCLALPTIDVEFLEKGSEDE